MRIFAIRDEYAEYKKDLAYLVYYEQSKTFYIELPEDSDPWEVPLLLDSFVKKGAIHSRRKEQPPVGEAENSANGQAESRYDTKGQRSERI